MKIFFAITILFFSFVSAAAQYEQAPILEKEFAYKDWNYPNVRSEGSIDLRDFAKGKKLVLVVYFAPWCPNWRHEAPFAERLYEKYKASGLDVIGVGEYDTVAAMKTNLEALKITFPVVYESEARDAKQKTLHYEYRKHTGDTRSWGSPWNVFLLPGNIESKGDVLTLRAPIVNGELIEPEAEKFVREKLGLPAEEAKAAATAAIEPCKEDVGVAPALKKPN
jgi:thiol-disulfide isomerase/thioredoxin